MSYHLTTMPKNSMEIEPDFKGRFFIATKSGSRGGWSCVSDEDPQDDVRGWMSLSTARSVASRYPQQGWPAQAIIQVTTQGWMFHPIVPEVEFASYPDGGSW